MSFADSTLPELAQRLLACAERSLLDVSLDVISQQVADEDAAELLRTVHEAGEADTLRDLLHAERLDEWTARHATTREARVLGGQIQRWLGVGERGADDPARLAHVAPLPDDLDAILLWARPYQLLGELSRPAREVLPQVREAAPDVSLVELALGTTRVGRGRSLLHAQAAQREARAYLLREAASSLAVGAREALWRQAPAQALKLLSERLRAVIADAPLTTLHAISFVPARLVHVDAQTGVARAQLNVDDPRGSITVKVYLSGHEQRPLHTECELCSRLGCVHARVLCARLLDACIDTGDRLHATLSALVQVPSWQRFLHAVRAEPSAHDKGATQRLVFRLRVDGERVSVGAVQQRVQPSGAWNEGKLVAAFKHSRGAECDERDRPVLEAMAFTHRSTKARFVLADLAMLRTLVEHPRLRMDGSDEAVSLSEQSVEITLLEQPEGLLPRITLGGAKVTSVERPRDASHLLHFDAANATVIFAALTPSLRRLLAALASFHGVLPSESYPQLAPWLAGLQQVARVTTPSVLRGTERPAPTQLLLRITPCIEQGIDVALMQRALPMSPLWSPGQGPVLAYGLEGGKQVFVRRDLEQERDNAKHVIEALALDTHLRLEPFAFRIEDNQRALSLLAQAARLTDRIHIEWAERARQLSVTTTLRASDLKVDLFKRGRWFDLEGGVRHAGADIAVGRLLNAARLGDRYVQISGGDYAEIEQDLFERLQRAQLCTNDSVREPSLSSTALPFWIDVFGEQSQSTDHETRALIERLRRRATEPAAPLTADALPERWQARLRPYQQQGVAWLIAQSQWMPGACLADEMGLGKTIQAIALIELRATLGPTLVVAPTSLVTQWCDELQRFAPTLNVHTHQGKTQSKRAKPTTLAANDVLVISYDMLLRDQARFDGVSFATQIIDEAQMAKNARTQRARAVASIDAAFVVALSGTPIENRLGDLWSLFQLIAPGLLGSWARFRARFAVPIERYESVERADALRQLVAPFILRRTKNQVALELPSRSEVTHTIEMSPAEKDLYDAAVRQARRAIGRRRKDDNGLSMQILAELTRLRQLACHPRLVVDDERVESSKLGALMQLLDDILPRGHRVLIFSQFTRHLALIAEALNAAQFTSLYLDGATPASQRALLVKRFQDREAQTFLISLKAGGTGLNLTAADYVVHMDPWWNPAAEDQASDRAHRIGQTQPITVVKLVMQGTIEEKVLALHGHKRHLAESVLSGSAQPSSLSIDELQDLLSSG